MGFLNNIFEKISLVDALLGRIADLEKTVDNLQECIDFFRLREISESPEVTEDNSYPVLLYFADSDGLEFVTMIHASDFQELILGEYNKPEKQAFGWRYVPNSE